MLIGAEICLTGDLHQDTYSHSVAQPSTRQKSVALEHGRRRPNSSAQEVIWLKRLLKDIQDISLLHKPADLPSSPIYMENQSAMALTRNAEYQKRTKHIDIYDHFARECVATGKISVAYIPTY